MVALALVTIAIRLRPSLYQTMPCCWPPTSILFLPRAIVTIRAALAQAPPVLDDAARVPGCRPAGRSAGSRCRCSRPGIGAGAALVFLAVVTELTATLLLAPTAPRRWPRAFWTRAARLDYGAAAPTPALMVLLSAPLTYLLRDSHGRGLT